MQEGLVGSLGLSNYSAVETERCLALCAENGWAAPTVYQGLYNPLNRRIEAELLPTLRKVGPLAPHDTQVHDATAAAGHPASRPAVTPRAAGEHELRCVQPTGRRALNGKALGGWRSAGGAFQGQRKLPRPILQAR